MSESCASCGSELEEDDLLELVCPLGCETQPPQHVNAEAADGGGVGDKDNHSSERFAYQRLDKNPQIPLRDTALEPVFRRIPPQCIEIEQALLGTMLVDNGIMPEVFRAVTASHFYRESHREIFKAMNRLHERGRAVDLPTLLEELRHSGLYEAVGGSDYLVAVAAAEGIPNHYSDYAQIVIEKALRRDAITATGKYLEGLYNGSSLPELADMAKRLIVPNTQGEKGTVAMMDYNQSVVLNAEYLARPEIIERLGYAQSIALIIGGKHHGKTTNVRTLALSVCRGLPIWGRKTTKGPVLYMASDDELASTRNELLSMGWNQNDPLWLGSLQTEGEANVDRILADIAAAAIKHGAVMIVLDMLFDFAGIKDELSYAATRASIGQIQWLADTTKCLVVCSHHTPKYLTDAHTASNAALGSQGISARFSPIILTRKWTERLYTVESTTTRDPRGQALPPTRIQRNEQGWIDTAGEFKESMKWELYADRILALFDVPNRGLNVYTIADRLELDRSRVQTTLLELVNAKKLTREKAGRSYLYYLASSDMFERDNGNWNTES